MKLAHELFFGGSAIWLGQGIINFSMTQDQLKFYARWTVNQTEEGEIYCVQEVEIDGMHDKMENHLHFYEINGDKFAIEVENTLWGIVYGKGVISTDTVAWEFRRQGEGFEGLEVYQMSSGGQYLLRADYLSPDMYRTQIEGELWKK